MQRITQRTLRMGHDGDLADRLGILLLGCHQRVAHLMIGDDPLFLLGDDGAFLFAAGDDHLKGHQQIVLVHSLASLADGAQRRLVHQIGQVRAHAACGGLSDFVQIHILGQMDVAGMHLQRGQTACQIGPIHGDTPVKPARTQQRLIQHLGAVGGGQHDDTLAGVKAVHLGQQLVQRLLPLVVAAAEAAVARLADGVDLIDENDTGGHLGRLLEQIADPAGTHAHKHLHKPGTGDGEKRNTRLAGHGLGQQGLPGAGRANQQRTLGQLGADGGILARIMQEVDDLLQRLLGLVLPGHILEGNAGRFFHIHLGVGFAHIPDAAEATAAGFAEDADHQHEQAHHDQRGQDIVHHEQQHRVGLRFIIPGIGHMMLLQQRQQLVVGEICRIQCQLGILGLGIAFGFLLAALLGLLGVGISLHRGDVDGLVPELNLLDLILFDHIHHLAVFDLVAGGFVGGVAGIGADVVHHHRQRDGPGHQRQNTPQAVAVLVIFIVAVMIIGHKTLLEKSGSYDHTQIVKCSIPQNDVCHKRHRRGFSVKFL